MIHVYESRINEYSQTLIVVGKGCSPISGTSVTLHLCYRTPVPVDINSHQHRRGKLDVFFFCWNSVLFAELNHCFIISIGAAFCLIVSGCFAIYLDNKISKYTETSELSVDLPELLKIVYF